MRKFCASVLAGCLAAAAGCGSAGPAVGSGQESHVTGTITLDGEPLDMGMVFFEAGGKSGTGNIREGGTFADAGGVPSGTVKVKLSAQMYSYMAGRARTKTGGAEAKGGGGPPAQPGLYRVIPAKYMSFDTSKLTYDLKPGDNTIKIELSSK